MDHNLGESNAVEHSQVRFGGAGGSLVKVTFLLGDNAWHGYGSESLWALPLTGGYQLENSPFFAKGVSYKDVVRARSLEGTLVFSDVLARSGHSTYRVITNEERSQHFVGLWKALAQLGCTYEGVSGNWLLTIDVPPQANIHEVYSLLTAGENVGAWDFEEGHCGHAVNEAGKESNISN